MEGVGEAFVGSLSGLRMNADVVLDVGPRRESGVELFESLESGALCFALEIVLDDLVDGFDLALAIGLVGFVVELGRAELGEYPGELLGDINRSVVQEIPNSVFSGLYRRKTNTEVLEYLPGHPGDGI